ncbi:hypothetical protein FB45DRAFT_912935 [Roridomyces roridus]|uniref:Uncharacterized protein n=1 Tax=Roridomyces roridus TaxID=1738132 RepID=A0AAD7BWJ4_9AGAR|nr:hypothetical protein FB45DRAFT_912935 [Roridomyces roridus]
MFRSLRTRSGRSGLALDHGTHLWLEYHLKSLKACMDPETRECGWDVEARWTGDPSKGGTDSALGRAGRLAVRNAWFSEKRPETYGPIQGSEGIHPVDAVILRTEAFLRTAIKIADAPDVSEKIHPCTLIDLLTRRAACLERLAKADTAHLAEARVQYERAWNLLGGKGIQAARIAVKLGDVSQRLQSPDALAWWARAISLVSPQDSPTLVPTAPSTPPPSPAAQRVLVSALVSCSAFYATTRQLSEAKKVDEASLNLLRSIPSPDSLATTSPPQTLHSLTLLHRSAIFSSHLAEVSYAQRAPIAQCLQRLKDAAASSERVAYALVGTSVRAAESAEPDVERPLLPEFAKNPHLEKPASDLLRDARRTAADTWNLMGELAERMGHKQQAYEYYQRAIGWAGRHY